MIDMMHGDCLDLMKLLDDESVDLTVTSPPYDNLREYNGNIDQWCFAKFQGIARELYRVTKPGGVVVWIVADATVNGSETGTSFKQALYFMDCGFNLHDTMIWSKNSSPFPGINRYYSTFEYMFVFSKGKPSTTNLIADRKNIHAGSTVHGTDRQKNGETIPKHGIKAKRRVKDYGVRYNVWSIPGVNSNKERTGHPAQFPERLAHDHIISWSKPGDIVLDPFAGSGTTAIACIETGRQFIGFEICEEYYNIAKQRIANEQAQASMFNPE